MKSLTIKERHKTISGAIFDFAGFLTSLQNDFQVGSRHNVEPILKAIEEWAKEVGLNINESDGSWKNYL